jgi:lipopolysaccharide transport protein LptA
VLVPFAIGLVLAASDAGVLLARPVTISADKLEVFKKESRAKYDGHAKAIRDTLTLTCDTLDVFLTPAGDVQRITAHGNVVAIDGDREAHGEQAEFANDTGVLVVTGKPWGKQGAREVDGEIVTFTTGDNRLEVTKARTRVKEPKDQRLTIDADLLTFEGEKNEARWKGHVKAVKGKMTLFAPEVLAISQPNGDISRVKARGGVEVTEGDRWARGQFGDYEVEPGRLTVTGNPQARDGKTRMKGTKVTFLTGSEFLEVENATTLIEVDKKKKVP